MSKHQYVDDGKVYEADSDTGKVTEVGTVTPSSSSLVDDLLDFPSNVVNSVSDTIQGGIDTVTGGKK